jgi:hypothetical protein
MLPRRAAQAKGNTLVGNGSVFRAEGLDDAIFLSDHAVTGRELFSKNERSALRIMLCGVEPDPSVQSSAAELPLLQGHAKVHHATGSLSSGVTCSQCWCHLNYSSAAIQFSEFSR